MRVLITGSRDFDDPAAVTRVHMVMNMVLALCDLLGQKLTVVHGACPSGADQIVDVWARAHQYAGVTVEAHPADWARHGRRAGPMRNEKMVDLGADLCFGFLKNNSSGTQNCLSLARNAKITTFVVHWEEL